MEYSIKYLKKVHKFSSNHKEELNQSKLCGCFHCCEIFKPDKIIDWIDEEHGETAVCPLCHIDSVLSDKHPIIDQEFLEQMNNYWF